MMLRQLLPLAEQEQKLADQTVKLNQVREQLLQSFSKKYNQDYQTLTINKVKDIVKDHIRASLLIFKKAVRCINKTSVKE